MFILPHTISGADPRRLGTINGMLEVEFRLGKMASATGTGVSLHMSDAGTVELKVVLVHALGHQSAAFQILR